MTLAPVEPVDPVEAAEVAPAPTPRRARHYAVLVASHLNVDLYPIFIVALAVSLQSNLALSDTQRATVIALGPIVSGLFQPLFAWLGDRFDTRLVGPVGLAVGAVAISSIGFAQSYAQLLTLQTIGLVGIGVYHPIAAAVAGRLGEETLTGVRFVHSPRTTGLSIFFLAGMLGGFLGPLISTRINSATGDMRWLAVMAVPGVLMAWALWIATRRIAHRHPVAPGADAAPPLAHLGRRRRCVAVLFASNALRFIANVGLYYIFTAWAKARFADNAVASARAGDMIAATTLGMALAAVFAGMTRSGRERRLLVWSGLLAAPCVLAMPFVPPPAMMVLTGLAAVFYFLGVPTAIGLAHRLLPHSTGMTGALLMGVGWVVSALGPLIAERVIATGEHGLTAAFLLMGGALAVSGLVGLLLDQELVRDAAEKPVS